MTNHGVSTEDCSICINHHVVFDGRVAFRTANQFAVRIGGKAQCAERDPLIDLHMGSDFTSLSDNHTGAVIDKEVLADASSRMDIDTRLFVSPFTHHSWDKGDFQTEQFVSDSVNGYGFQAGETEDDLIAIRDAWVTGKRGIDILGEG